MKGTNISKEVLIEDIVSFIKVLEKRWSVKVNFTAVSNIFMLMSSFCREIMSYTFHDNIFCNYIKLNEKCFAECVSCKRKIAEKLKDNPEPFFGSCHFGIGEYVFPIVHNSILIAYLCVGEFESVKGRERLNKRAEKFSLSSSLSSEYFEKITKGKEEISEKEEFFMDFKALSRMISYLYTLYEALDNDTEVKNPIVKGALLYIAENYNTNITLGAIAKECHCNKNYLCSVFGEVVGKSVNTYIKDYRIDRALDIMHVKKCSITELSYMCGFASPSYFATVFKERTGYTPKEYKLNILKVNP